ncbi:hypothetical protein JOQ06_026432 [Pogonophryne albipinna]|uniref:Uncharacterized protein n=1 Tax=Pogonophryne albipinna TaxID=1090488 RepID=A0AAD6BB35_9TELE|nr:hypothetical protein JOQ06_026432 [Pogonophryne albipinna]
MSTWRQEFFEAVDFLTAELKRRFDQDDMKIAALRENVLIEAANSRGQQQTLELESLHLPQLISDVDRYRLDLQLKMLGDAIGEETPCSEASGTGRDWYKVSSEGPDGQEALGDTGSCGMWLSGTKSQRSLSLEESRSNAGTAGGDGTLDGGAAFSGWRTAFIISRCTFRTLCGSLTGATV